MVFLEYLVRFADVIIESICIVYIFYVCLYILNLKTKLLNSSILYLFFFVLTAVLLCQCLNYIPSIKWIKPFLHISITATGIFTCCKCNIYKSLIIPVATMFFSAMIEILLVLLLKGLQIDPANVAANPIFNGLLSSSILIIEAIIAYIAYIFFRIFKNNNNMVNNKLKYFLPQLIAIIICLFPTMILLMLTDFKNSAVYITVNLIQLLTISIVGMHTLKFVVKHENTETELANTIIYNETLSKVNEGVRGFKHDMGNIVQAILGYIAANDINGAKKYCQNLVIGFNDINVLSILSPKVIDDPAMYGVVVNKILVAREKNMTLSLDITANIAQINFPKFELSRILGILIDNAIEAGEKTDEKKLILNIRHDYEQERDIITISNSIKDVNISIDRIFEKNYSTKETPSGFGLYEVSKFLKQNPQAVIATSIDTDKRLFTQTVIIKSNDILMKQCIETENTVA